MNHEIRFYDPLKTTIRGNNRVPHWSQAEATYFVTLRLMDAIPMDALASYRRERQEWLAAHGEPPWSPDLDKEYRRRFTSRFERWLDSGSGSCLLADEGNGSVVEECLRHFENERTRLHAWVVMPNHVHVLFSLVGDATLSGIMHSWKGFSSRTINARRGASGSIWQKGYFDRIVRDWAHFASCARYIRCNPEKAKVAEGCFSRGESDLVRRMLAGDMMTANSGRP